MRPVVITVFDSEAGTTADHTFASSPVRIGRNPLNDLALPFPFVSGWHAVVRFDDGAAKFFDLGSTNGTLLNGRKIQAGEPVTIGDMLSVTIGRLELRFRRADAVSAGYPAASYGANVSVPPQAPYPVPQSQPTQGPAAHHQAPGGVPQPPAPVGGGYHHSSQQMPAAVERPSSRPPSAPAAGSPNTAHVQMSDVHNAIARLRPRYDAYRQAWQALNNDLRTELSGMPVPLRELSVSMVTREFPGLDSESDFVALAGQLGVKVAGGGGGGSGDGLAAVQQLSRQVCPDDPPPRSTEEAGRFLACVEDVVRASAKAFVELQKGQEQFGREMGVRTIKEFTPLHAAGTPENVLKYLLDWQKGGPHRTKELVGVYADLMIHQVALINGVMEGVRSMLAQLDPAEIERGVSSAWGRSGSSAWRAFVQRYQELTETDRNITEYVFGPEFARAYAEVGGEGSRG